MGLAALILFSLTPVRSPEPGELSQLLIYERIVQDSRPAIPHETNKPQYFTWNSSFDFFVISSLDDMTKKL